MRVASRALAGGVAFLAVAVGSSLAQAQVFPETTRRLCPNGQVDRRDLAMAIVSEARAALHAATSNADGGTPHDLTWDEAIYAITHLDSAPGSSAGPRPFGPLVNLDEDPSAKSARDRILTELRGLISLVETGRLDVGRTRYTLTTRSGGAVPIEAGVILQIFEGDSPYVIRCGANPDAPPTLTGTALNRGSDASGPPTWRVRGAASDLATLPSEGDLSGLKPATFGFSRDEVADTETLNLNIVVGRRSGPASGAWEAFPYLSYERKDAPAAGDLEKFSPGLLLSHHIHRSGFSMLTKLEVSYIFDVEQSAEHLRSRLYFEPNFQLPDGRMLFGQTFDFSTIRTPWGYLRARPELQLIADWTDVRDPGSNPAFQTGGSYFGAGADLSLRLALGPESDLPASGWSLSGGRRQMWLSGDIVADDPGRWYGKLEYTLKTYPLGLALTYSEGENDDTFQLEDTLALQLTWRR